MAISKSSWHCKEELLRLWTVWRAPSSGTQACLTWVANLLQKNLSNNILRRKFRLNMLRLINLPPKKNCDSNHRGAKLLIKRFWCKNGKWTYNPEKNSSKKLKSNLKLRIRNLRLRRHLCETKTARSKCRFSSKWNQSNWRSNKSKNHLMTLTGKLSRLRGCR